MAVEWGLAQGPNAFQSAFSQGLQLGDMVRQRSEERKTSNALSGLVANPQQDDAAFAELIKGLPGNAALKLSQARQGYQQNAATQQRAQQESRRADLPMLTNLLRNSTDQATYDRNLATARQYGVDTSTIPQQFDPQWRDQQLTTLQALQQPGGQEALSTAGKEAADAGFKPGTPQFNDFVRNRLVSSDRKVIPYTAGGGVGIYDPASGGVSNLITPNTGNAPAGTPVQQSNVPRLTNPSEVSSLKPGQQFYDPNGVLRQVPGGPTQPASGGFR